MPSITSWTRLESRTRADEPTAGLEARVHDPLWLLGRQWQLGELRGDDAGSPVAATVTVRRAAFAGYLPFVPADGQVTTAEPLAPDRPLEAVVAGAARLDLRWRVRAGQRLLDALFRGGLTTRGDHYIAAAPFDPPAVGASEAAVELLAVVIGKVPDGEKLRAVIRAELAAGVPTELEAVLVPWLAWAERERGGGAGAWNPARLEYELSLAASGAPTVVAPELRSPELAWYEFDARPGVTVTVPGQAVEVPHRVVPAPVRYPGMPALRFWQFEDEAVWFGGVEVGATDLGRMLLVELALTGADDWFVAPVRVESGLYSLARLEVVDSFGRTRTIDPVDAGGSSPGARWAMYRPVDPGGQLHSLLVIPPGGAAAGAGEPVEELRVIRDEGANLGWAIEHLVDDELGRPVDLRTRAAAERPPSGPPSATLAYRLRTEVRQSYIPLVPVERDPGQPGTIELRRGRLAGGTDHVGRGSLVGEITTLPEEVVPREGLRLTRGWRYVRWVDGSRHMVSTREVELGASAPVSDLRYDVVGPRED
jgi:hypothetical protein